MALVVDRNAALSLNAGNAVAFTTDFAAAAPGAPTDPNAIPSNIWHPVGACDQTGLTEAFAATTVNVMAIGILTPWRVLYTDKTRTFQLLMLEAERDICQSVMFNTSLAALARVPNTPPTLTSATVAAGGSLAVGAYFYKITGTTGSGETTASNEVTATTASSNLSVTLVWPAVPSGTTGIKVYRTAVGGGAGTENALVATLSSVTSPYVDTGGATTAASPPTVSTAGLRTVAEASAPVPDRRAWLIRLADGTVTQQIYLPAAEVTARANVAWAQNDVAKFDVTMTAYPDATGAICYRLDNAPVTPLQSNS